MFIKQKECYMDTLNRFVLMLRVFKLYNNRDNRCSEEVPQKYIKILQDIKV